MSSLESDLDKMKIDKIIKMKKKINFNPPYQRNSVWGYNAKVKFINSIMTGRKNGTITLNRLGKKDKSKYDYICIDGKQRVEALEEFMENYYPILDNGTVTFFSEEPDNEEWKKLNRSFKDKDIETMNKKEQEKFKKDWIPCLVYDDLTYAEQTELFEALQNGAPLSSGEKASSRFRKEECAVTFNKFCEKSKKLWYKYLKETKTDRKSYIPLITCLMFMVYNKECKFPTATSYKKFYKEIDNIKELKKLFGEVQKLQSFFFNANMYSNDKISTKARIHSKYLLTIMFAIYDSADDKYGEILKSNPKCKSLVKAIKYVFSQATDAEGKYFGRVKKEHIEDVDTNYWNMYEKYFNNDDYDSSDSDDSDSDGDDSDSDNDNSDNDDSDSDDNDSDDENSDNTDSEEISDGSTSESDPNGSSDDSDNNTDSDTGNDTSSESDEPVERKSSSKKKSLKKSPNKKSHKTPNKKPHKTPNKKPSKKMRARKL